jgi:hypothetical protein
MLKHRKQAKEKKAKMEKFEDHRIKVQEFKTRKWDHKRLTNLLVDSYSQNVLWSRSREIIE